MSTLQGTQSPPALSSCITPFWAIYMLFFAFEGIRILAWPVLAAFGYPQNLFGIDHFYLHAGLKSCAYVLLLYVIYKGYRCAGMRAFAGLSWPILIFLCMLYLSICFYSYYYENKYTWLNIWIWLFIPILAFAIPMSERSIKYGFKVFFFSLLFLMGFCLCLFYPEMLAGESLRGSLIRNTDYQHFSFSLVSRTSRLFWIFSGTIGALAGLVSLWLWVERRMNVFLTILIYVLGLSLCLFTASRTNLLCWIVCHLILFILSYVRKHKWHVILALFSLLLFLNAGLAVFFAQDNHGITKRGRDMAFVFTNVASFTKPDEVDVVSNTTPPVLPSPVPVPTPASEGVIQVPSAKSVIQSPASEGVVQAPSAKSVIQSPASEGVIQAPSAKNVVFDRFLEAWKEMEDKIGVERGIFEPANPLRRYDLITLNNTRDARLAMFVATLVHLYHHPLAGTQGRLYFRVQDELCYGYTHNIFLDAFLYTGVIGGCVFLLIVFRALLDSAHLLMRQPAYGWLGLVFVFCLIYNTTSGGVYSGVSSTNIWIWAVALRASMFLTTTRTSETPGAMSGEPDVSR